MIPTLAEIKSRIAANRAELARLEEESRRASEGFGPSERTFTKAKQFQKQAQDRFNEAVILKPGTQEESHAQEELMTTQEELERAKIRFQAFEAANSPAAISARQQRIQDLAAVVNRDRETAWAMVRTQELEKVPQEDIQRIAAALLRVFAAQGFGTFTNLASGIFAPLCPTEAEVRSMRKEMAQAYGME